MKNAKKNWEKPSVKGLSVKGLTASGATGSKTEGTTGVTDKRPS